MGHRPANHTTAKAKRLPARQWNKEEGEARLILLQGKLRETLWFQSCWKRPIFPGLGHLCVGALGLGQGLCSAPQCWPLRAHWDLVFSVWFLRKKNRPYPSPSKASGDAAFLHHPIFSLHACVLSCFSRVQLFVTPRTVAHQSPLSVGFSRQEYWRGLSFPPPGNLPNPRIEPTSFPSPELAGGFFTTSASWKVLFPKLSKRAKSSKNLNRKSSFLCLLQPWRRQMKSEEIH